MTIKTEFSSRAAIILLTSILVTAGAHAAAPLFPTPLHLTREIIDPISGTTTVVDEYCHGNRIVSISGPLTSIADYAKGEVTRIDRGAGTYSVARFEEIASSGPRGLGSSVPRERSMAATVAPEARSLGVRGIGGRSAEVFEIEWPGADGLRRIEVGVDPAVTLSKDAIEVLIGAAWPHSRRLEHDAILAASRNRDSLRASSGDGTAPDRYRLPLEQTLTFGVAGETVTFTNRVTRVGDELPPTDLIMIPAGATRVEDERLVAQRLLEELDRLPSEAPKH